LDKEALLDEVRALTEEYLKAKRLELVDLIYRFEGRDLFLRFLVDRPESGITMEECAALNRQIGSMLDEKNILSVRYILEVSSPGLDRPLVTKNDFRRCVNKKAKFFLNEPVKEKIEWDGLIKFVGDNEIFLEVSGGELEIPLEKISKAKQII
jgi:ribosome maturation factor RimP